MRSFFLLAALVALGCQTPTEGEDTDGGGGGEGGDSSSGEMREGYPSGPYGTAVGGIMKSESFTTPDEGMLSVNDLHADAGKKLLFVTTAAGWCTACIEEQPTLKALHAEWASKGLTILVTVFEDSQYNKASAANAAEWKQRYGLPFDVVADPENLLGAYYDTSLAPMNMMVDLETMEILFLEIGWKEELVRAVIGAKL